MSDPTNPATLADVQGTIERPLTDGERQAIPAWLDQAWTILQVDLPGIAGRIDSGGPTSLPRAAVAQVVAAMVERKLRNPDGLRGWTADDVTQTIDAALSTGQLYVTPDEHRRLMVRVPLGGFFSIALGR